MQKRSPMLSTFYFFRLPYKYFFLFRLFVFYFVFLCIHSIAGDWSSPRRQSWFPAGCEYQKRAVCRLRQHHQFYSVQLHQEQMELEREKKVVPFVQRIELWVYDNWQPLFNFLKSLLSGPDCETITRVGFYVEFDFSWGQIGKFIPTISTKC